MGPGLGHALELLKASDQPRADRKTFFKAQLTYWLLGATDGHAKNFSIHLYPGGQFRLAPLYDVMSAQPALDAHQVRRNAVKLAMSIGDSRHYAVHEIRLRHFHQSARAHGLPEAVLTEIVDEIRRDLAVALETVTSTLPPDFPTSVVDSIAAGARARLRLLE